MAEYKQEVEGRLKECQQSGDLQGARELLEKASLRTKPLIDLQRALGPKGILLAKSGVEVIHDHTVLFVIPKGVSRIEILEEVQDLITHPNGRPFIYPAHLAEWTTEDRFASQQATSKRLCIDGHVRGGDAKTRGQQEAFLGEEFTMANIEDLAVAFCLHWVATGEPLFGWFDGQEGWSKIIRAVGDALRFGDIGLGAYSINDVNAFVNIGVSACVSPE
jgi:hypothetical protein